jgi:hypothetical protein
VPLHGGTPRPRRHDREPTAGHAQQHGGAIGIAAGGKPADVLGGAVLTLQHGFRQLSIGSYVAACLPDASTSSHLNFFSKHMTCQANGMLRFFGYGMMTLAQNATIPATRILRSATLIKVCFLPIVC